MGETWRDRWLAFTIFDPWSRCVQEISSFPSFPFVMFNLWNWSLASLEQEEYWHRWRLKRSLMPEASVIILATITYRRTFRKINKRVLWMSRNDRAIERQFLKRPLALRVYKSVRCSIPKEYRGKCHLALCDDRFYVYSLEDGKIQAAISTDWNLGEFLLVERRWWWSKHAR